MDEGARDGDHAWVRLPPIPHFWHTGNPLHIYIRAGFVAMPSLCAVSGRATMPWQPTVIPAVHQAHASSPSSYESYLPSHLVTSRPTLFCVAAQIYSVSITCSVSARIADNEHHRTPSRREREHHYRYLSYQHPVVLGLEEVKHLVRTVTDELGACMPFLLAA